MTRTEIRKNFETIISIYKNTREGKTTDTVAALVDALGYDNAVLTVAELVNTVGDWDQRISDKNREWAGNVAEAASRDELREMGIYQPSEIHPAHIDQIADAMRKYEPTEPTEPETETAPSVDPAELVEGDVVEITGAYFKNDNGLYFVTNTGLTWRGNMEISLEKIGKTGKVLKNGYKSWPLVAYCSDREKAAAARKHNADHARLSRADGVDLSGVAEWFREEAEKAAQGIEDTTRRGWTVSDAQRARLEDLRRVCDRFSGVSAPVKEPETGIKFYYNGIKINGGDLIKCSYSFHEKGPCYDQDTVTIYANGYGADLPREYFTVTNDSDIMTDYFDHDRAELTPSHPLYKYVRYAAYKAAKRHSWSPEREKVEPFPDPGQPTAADLAAVAELKTAAESARLAAEHAARLAERERVLKIRCEGREYIESVISAHPAEDGAPVVEITWSEHPAFSSWTESRDQIKLTITKDAHGRTVDEKKEITVPRRRCFLSVAAADIVLRYYDDEMKESGEKGYYKTGFVITWKDAETGEDNTYEGRYDIGDGDGGIVAHVRALAEWDRDNATTDECREAAEERLKTADFLAGFLPGGRVVKVEFAPWLLAAMEAKKQKEDEARERFNDTLTAVGMLTDEQLIDAVNLAPYADPEKRDVGRFFLQQLAQRDEKKAVEVFKKWVNGEKVTPE